MPMTRRQALAATGAALIAPHLARAAATALPGVRVGLTENDPLGWELQTIQRHGFDRANGFHLVPMVLASAQACQFALARSLTEAVAADLSWVGQQRAAGKGLVLRPGCRAAGALVTPAASPVADLGALRGKVIAVQGGPLTPDWLTLRAFSRLDLGEDLAGICRVQTLAPDQPEQALTSGADAIMGGWADIARLAGAATHQMVTITTATQTLGLDPATPITGLALRDDWIAAKPDLAMGLARALRAAKELLLKDDAAWQPLRPRMLAGNEAAFQALRAAWRASIVPPGPVDQPAADRMLHLLWDMAGTSGGPVVGPVPPGLFWTAE